MGGGARGSYQAGVLKGIGEITQEMGIQQPFPILTGVSAGAVNAGFLAAYSDDMRAAIQQLAHTWGSIRSDTIYKVDLWSLAKIAARGSFELIFGAYGKKSRVQSLLDTEPLRQFAYAGMPYGRIQQNIDQGHLRALAITAVSYTDGMSHVFYQGHESIQPWFRHLRKAVPTEITAEHILASAAIPLLFKPISMTDGFYGDGSLRNYAPLSPAIKLGAERLLVIGVRRPEQGILNANAYQPSPGRVISVILNSLLLDAIDIDYERLTRINGTIEKLAKRAETELKPIKVCIIRPSEDIGRIAAEQADAMPKVVRHFVGGLGSRKESSDLISYLLFEPAFTHWLMDLGYRDAMAQRQEIVEFYS